MKKGRFSTIIGVIMLVAGVGYAASAVAETSGSRCDIATSAWCVAPRIAPTIDRLSSVTIPKIATPIWLTPAADLPAATVSRSVNYSVASRGVITADLTEFRAVVAATLNDSRGWTRLGVRFQEVETGAQFTVYLTEAAQMTSFSATGCDNTYSCNVGSAVVINQDRWLGASPTWTAAGGDLASYRQMVINHETGHWLGHGHRSCSAAGQPAPVMQQQSMDMQGCTTNPWPLTAEMYSPMLGIRS